MAKDFLAFLTRYVLFKVGAHFALFRWENCFTAFSSKFGSPNSCPCKFWIIPVSKVSWKFPVSLLFNVGTSKLRINEDFWIPFFPWLLRASNPASDDPSFLQNPWILFDLFLRVLRPTYVVYVSAFVSLRV